MSDRMTLSIVIGAQKTYTNEDYLASVDFSEKIIFYCRY